MRFSTGILVFACLALSYVALPSFAVAGSLHFAIGHADITPDVTPPRAVWMAGYYHGRAATSVHDPLFARGMLLSDGETTVAIVSLDLIGWSYPSTVEIRQQLPGIDFLTICCTHNHEGPDTIGIWGESPIKRGVDEKYNARVEETVVQLVTQLQHSLQPVSAEFAKIDRPDLVHDSRLPTVIDPTLRALCFRSKVDGEPVGLLVQGTAHPESLGAGNTRITADFPNYTQQRLHALFGCPTVYVSGAIGGLLAPPPDGIYDAAGTPMRLTTFEYAETYGNLVAEAIADALRNAQPLELTPIRIQRKEVAIPIDNPLYRLARSLNVIRRISYQWLDSPNQWGKQVTREYRPERAAIVTEVSIVTLGQLKVLNIPGELYPELVNGIIPDPAEENVDFPNAPIEPIVSELMQDDPYLLFGLANDEIGYIMPKRQWDREPPFAYGRSTPQYGEINSCSFEVGPIIMQALAELCQQAKTPAGTSATN